MNALRDQNCKLAFDCQFLGVVDRDEPLFSFSVSQQWRPDIDRPPATVNVARRRPKPRKRSATSAQRSPASSRSDRVVCFSLISISHNGIATFAYTVGSGLSYNVGECLK